MVIKMQRAVLFSLKSRKHRKARSKIPYNVFDNKFWLCDDLIKSINKKITNPRLRYESRKQYVIGLVTSFEVYLKDTLAYLIKKNKINLSKLIEKKEKIFNFFDVKQIIEKKISLSELIVYSYSFQNLEIIEEIFSRALGIRSLFQKLGEYKFFYNEEDKRNYYKLPKNFIKDLENLFELRHSFVHEINFKKRMKMNELNYLSGSLLTIVTMLDLYIEEFTEKKSSQNSN